MALAAVGLVAAIVVAAFVFAKRMEERLRLQEELAARESSAQAARPRPNGPVVMEPAPKDLPGDSADRRATALNMLNAANHGALVKLAVPERRARVTDAAASKKPATTATAASAPPAAAKSASPRPRLNLNGGSGLSGGIGHPFQQTVGGEGGN
ncbi:MAG: hypothetical protein HY059_09920 [Proteobacteria bacterium]|nr:hypothetical protein [Pseudomonadota bacterium]